MLQTEVIDFPGVAVAERPESIDFSCNSSWSESSVSSEGDTSDNKLGATGSASIMP